MTTKTKKSPKTDDGALRAAMAALSKRSTKDLRAAYQATMKRSPNGLSRSALIRTLVTTAATEKPPASHPTKAEQTAAKEAAQTDAKDGDRRHTGARDPRLPTPGSVLTRSYKGATTG